MSFKSVVHNKQTTLLLSFSLVVGIVFYYVVDPETTPCLRCPFQLLFGLKCPGCGSQRALHHILHFEFLDALKDNALFVVMIPFLMIFGIAKISRYRLSRLELFFNGKWPVTIMLLLITLWFIGRNHLC